MTEAEAARPVDIANLPSLADFEFTGGRSQLAPLARRLFAAGGPRFLRSEDSLVVVRNADLRTMAAIPALGNVPSGILSDKIQRGADLMKVADSIGDKWVGSSIAEVFANQFTFNNEPIHKPLKKILVGQIGPRSVGALEAEAYRIARALLEEVADTGVIDFGETVALQLTLRFWGGQIGLTDGERDVLRALLRTLSTIFSVKRDPAAFRQLDDAFAAYSLVMERAGLRSALSADFPMVQAIASHLAALDLHDEPNSAGIVPRNAGMMLAGVMTDGFHTAAAAAANVVHVLAREAVLDRLAEEPSLLPAAIAEALRLEPPVIMLNRYAVADIIYDGLLIPRGTNVVMMWGVGNRDPSVFAEPDRFDLDRGRQAHTTFGGGSQLCPGRDAAAMLIRALLRAVGDLGLDIVPIASSERWSEDYIMCQLETFPVRITRKANATHTEVLGLQTGS